MRLEKPSCPECGAPAIGTLDRIPGVALFDPGDDPTQGPVEYVGETDVDWDGQQTETDPMSEDPIVVCANGHTWDTAIDR